MFGRKKDIWKIKDQNNFIVALDMQTAQKCQYGDDMNALSAPERVFYITQTLEQEVNNGGFDQFFINSSGNFANELVAAFTEIGAHRTAAICKKALDALGGTVPVNREEREKMLDETITDEVTKIISECDDAFYDYEDDLNALNYAYIMKHKEFFQQQT